MNNRPWNPNASNDIRLLMNVFTNIMSVVAGVQFPYVWPNGKQGVI